MLIILVPQVLADVKTGGGPLWAARVVDPAPPGCVALRRYGARELLGSAAQQAPRPGVPCTWQVPGTPAIAQLWFEPKEALAQAGLSLRAAVERDRPWKVTLDEDGYPKGPAHVEGEARADFDINGLPGWSRTVRTGPREAVTQLVWVNPQGLVTLTYRRQPDRDLASEENDGSIALIYVDRRLDPSGGLTSMSGSAPR